MLNYKCCLYFIVHFICLSFHIKQTLTEFCLNLFITYFENLNFKYLYKYTMNQSKYNKSHDKLFFLINNNKKNFE